MGFVGVSLGFFQNTFLHAVVVHFYHHETVIQIQILCIDYGFWITGHRRLVQTNGTFKPSQNSPHSDAKIALSNAVSASVVRTAGTFHPVSSDEERRSSVTDQKAQINTYSENEGGVESHEKALNALRGHLTGRRPLEEPGTSKYDDTSYCSNEPSNLPPKKRKSFHFVETKLLEKEETVIESISPAPTQQQVETRRLSWPQAQQVR